VCEINVLDLRLLKEIPLRPSPNVVSRATDTQTKPKVAIWRSAVMLEEEKRNTTAGKAETPLKVPWSLSCGADLRFSPHVSDTYHLQLWLVL
jgi:hypothetical protein